MTKFCFVFLPIFGACLALLSGCSHVGKKPDAMASAAANSYDSEATNFPYPYPVHFYEFESQKQRLKMAYVDVAGERPNGRTVLLLHGKNFSAAQWQTTIESLRTRGFRVVAPDQIGFGKSSKPEGYQFSFQALAGNTIGLIDELHIQKVEVVGHSMGGMLATRLALMYPGRVDKLVLVNPLGLEDWKTMVASHSIDQIYAQELKATPESIKEYQRASYYDGQWKPEYDALIALQAGWTLNPEYPKVAWNSALTYDMIFTQPVYYEFSHLKVPTLLIIGQRDRTAVGKGWAPKEVAAKMGDYPALGRRAAKLIPGARLVEIKGVGHLPQIEAFPEYEKALMDFL